MRLATVAIRIGALVLVVGLTSCAPQEVPSPREQPLAAAQSAWSPKPAPVAERMPTPRFEALTVADGLVANEVSALLQDRQGFLWVGTFSGLSRYDGASFSTFVHDPADAGSLADNFVNALYEDRAGRT